MRHVEIEAVVWSKETSTAKTRCGEDAARAKSGSQGFCLVGLFLNNRQKELYHENQVQVACLSLNLQCPQEIVKTFRSSFELVNG